MAFEKPSRPRPVDPEGAETIALEALRFLASDPARLTRFMSLSGLDGAGLRALASSSEGLAAVLDYLLRDESLMLVFSAETTVAPERISAAHARLAGGAEPWP